MTKNRSRRRSNFIRPTRPLLGEHPPIGIGCMLAVLVIWALTFGAIAFAVPYLFWAVR